MITEIQLIESHGLLGPGDFMQVEETDAVALIGRGVAQRVKHIQTGAKKNGNSKQARGRSSRRR